MAAAVCVGDVAPGWLPKPKIPEEVDEVMCWVTAGDRLGLVVDESVAELKNQETHQSLSGYRKAMGVGAT